MSWPLAKCRLSAFTLISMIFLFFIYVHFNTPVGELVQNQHKSESLAAEADRDLIVVYNRVPKTGSTSFMGVTYDLCKQNGFHAIHVNISKNSNVLSLQDQRKIAANITNWSEKKPAIYHGHLAFLDFTRFGFRNPIYINIVREPLDRLVSYYYFLRFGDDFRPKLIRRKMGDTETFDECVSRSGRDCDPKNLWLQIPFFCGQTAECRRPGSVWAFEQAKRNLVEHYMVVGVTEDLLGFIAVLEATLPSMFKGAVDTFLQGSKSHIRKTKQKTPPSSETVAKMQESPEWKLEWKFYQFAKLQFDFVKKKSLMPTTEGLQQPQVPMAKSSEFHYEKIKPS